MSQTNKPDKIIVFPSGMPESVTFYQNNSDNFLIGASAIKDDPVNDIFDQWEFIPYVDTPEFDKSLLSLIEKTKPNAIFCPHRFALYYVNKLINEHKLSVEVIGVENDKLQQLRHSQSEQWLNEYHKIADSLDVDDSRRLNKTDINAVVRHALSIPGETGVEKIISLLAMGSSIPEGDVVEIGCLYGRTSFVFAWLARRYATGSTLCVDPWTTEAAIHQDTSSMARDAIRENYEYDSIFQQFKENLVPSFYRAVNYIRETSNEAALVYKTSNEITTPEFGNSRYTQSIACLHIDGNHDYAAVLDDVIQWAHLLQDKGWLIVDDYNWPFGEGPKLVANEILATNSANIEHSFVAGDALFIKFENKIDSSQLFRNEQAS